jgi:hypothetical protein
VGINKTESKSLPSPLIKIPQLLAEHLAHVKTKFRLYNSTIIAEIKKIISGKAFKKIKN